MRRAYLLGVLAFLYIPVLVLVAYSFNDSRFALAWEGFTLDWYLGVFRDPQIGRALRNTLVVSSLSTVISVVLGTALAIGFHFGRFRGKALLDGGVYLPILVPDVIQGVGLLSFFALVGFPLGLGSIILAHVSFQISFVALLVRARLDAFPRSLVEAARDLGAGPLQALAKIVLPLAAPGIVAGALMAFTLSVDDFLIAYFTAGPGASTLPIRIYSMIRRGVTPEVNALATLLLVFSLATISASVLLTRSPEEGVKAR
ncbi:MAG: ABC transporter permease [Gemmatimonadetes bacterium]|nr:ABC transporter permease [Gemmatimonadota bacterium]